MKFLRFLCNILLFFVVTVGISFTQIGVYDISAAQSKDVDGIHLIAPKEDNIAYFDSYTFWIDDITTNFKQPAKYRIRNWGSANWWKNGMGWADRGLDIVIAAIKPIIVPIAQVNAVKEFYGRDINDFDDNYFLKYVYDSEEEYNNALYELYIIFDMGYEEAYTADGTKLISEYDYTGGYDLAITYNNGDYGRWVNTNRQLYNYVWKLNKYNCGTYDKYFKKFISEVNGVRHIKTAAVVLYYQQYVSIIISLIFVIKYPVGMIQGRVIGKNNKDIQV